MFLKGYLYFFFFFKLNFILLFSLMFISIILFYYYNFNNNFLFNKNINIYFYLKFFLNSILIISFLIHFIVLILYLNYINFSYNNLMFNNILVPNFIINFNRIFGLELKLYLTVDFFGLLLLLLAYTVGFFSIFILDTRLYYNNIKYIFIFNIFLIIVYLYTSVSNYLVFFFLYECLLIPSFLFVFFVSPSRRAIQASIYFVIWTQIGSVLVLLVVSYFLSITGFVTFYSLKNFNFMNYEVYFLYFLLFLGFGFKIPIWPFHYWLTKTHVEAPSGFSIYLSGFLVKSALFGFYKFTNVFCSYLDTSLFSLICILGVLDSSLKMWGQTDLKKLVAYGTIQEMNLIYLVFTLGDSKAIIAGILFTVVHAFLSALMFFIVDCIYRRYLSRSIIELNGILNITPNLGLSIIFMVIFYAGLPGTIKFIVEFYIFSGFIEISISLCFILMFVANVFGLIGFSKCWFNALFGLYLKGRSNLILDLTKKEFFIIFSIFLFLFLFSFFINLFF